MKAIYKMQYTNGESIEVYKIELNPSYSRECAGLVLFGRNGRSKTTARALRVTAGGKAYFVPKAGSRVFLQAMERVS